MALDSVQTAPLRKKSTSRARSAGRDSWQGRSAIENVELLGPAPAETIMKTKMQASYQNQLHYRRPATIFHIFMRVTCNSRCVGLLVMGSAKFAAVLARSAAVNAVLAYIAFVLAACGRAWLFYGLDRPSSAVLVRTNWFEAMFGQAGSLLFGSDVSDHLESLPPLQATFGMILLIFATGGRARPCRVVQGRARSCKVVQTCKTVVVQSRARSCKVVRGRAKLVVQSRATLAPNWLQK